MRELTILLQALMARAFYGTVEIQFKEGCVVLVRQCETLKPPFLTGSPRENRNEDEHKR
jgi:hypothetical protein